LEEKDPSIRFRALTALLDLPEDHPDVLAAREGLSESRIVRRILAQIEPDGDWPFIDGYDRPEYGFSYLGELGLRADHPTVGRAVEAYLSKQYPDGSFPGSYSVSKGRQERTDESCYYALTFRGLVQLGCRQDPRLQRAVDFTLSQARFDGGYLCSKGYVKESTKSCIRGSKNVLLLFAELPELWDTAQCRDLVDYFLERKLFYARNDHTKFVRGRPRTIFPFHYRFGLLEPLYALSKMGYGEHPSLAEAWDFLAEKRDELGRYVLDWTLPKVSFRPGKKGQINKWVTLYALLALKQKAGGSNSFPE
jgi:hypothetical protein